MNQEELVKIYKNSKIGVTKQEVRDKHNNSIFPIDKIEKRIEELKYRRAGKSESKAQVAILNAVKNSKL